MYPIKIIEMLYFDYFEASDEINTVSINATSINILMMHILNNI